MVGSNLLDYTPIASEPQVIEDYTVEEEDEGFVDPNEYEYEDWIAYYSDELWNNWELYREHCYDNMMPVMVTFSEFCKNEYYS
jgi:hypothetical protein